MKRVGGRLLVLALLAGSLVLVCKASGSLTALSALAWTVNDAAASPEPAASPFATPTPADAGTLAAFGLSGPVTCRSSEPPTDSPWLAVAEADAAKYQIDPLAYTWKIWQESGFNPNVHNSSAGAIGIAQFMPATAQGLGIDPTDPAQSLDASAKLDASHIRAYADRARQLSEHYGGSSARYGYALALAAYNAGPGATDSAWNRAFGGGWPDSPWAWLSYLGGETQRYVPNILGCATT
jgi:soluble lytic murein transglycosylase-like protein